MGTGYRVATASGLIWWTRLGTGVVVAISVRGRNVASQDKDGGCLRQCCTRLVSSVYQISFRKSARRSTETRWATYVTRIQHNVQNREAGDDNAR
jgi:hypothetical protein